MSLSILYRFLQKVRNTVREERERERETENKKKIRTTGEKL